MKRCCYDGVVMDMERLVGRSIVMVACIGTLVAVSVRRYVEVLRSFPSRLGTNSEEPC